MYEGIVGVESVVYFQRRCRLTFVPPIWPRLNENEKQDRKMKNKKFEILKQKVVCRYGVQVHAGRTTTGRLCDNSSCAVQQHKLFSVVTAFTDDG